MMALAVTASSAVAGDWGNVAIISSTMGAQAGRLCIGEGLRSTDIGCPTYAPSVTTAGDVSVSGNLSAAKFIGDGSGLTGVATNLSETIGINDLYDAMVSGTGVAQSIFLGPLSGASLTTGHRNIGIGYATLGSATTAAQNTAVGSYALSGITTGTGSINNAAYGLYAGMSAAVVRNSVIVGISAAQYVNEISNSTIVGFQAAYANPSTKIYESALFGYKAGVKLTDAVKNTLIGTYAGQALTTGSSNTLVGYNAGGNLSTGLNNIMIGINTYAPSNSTSDFLNIGNVISGSMISGGTLRVANHVSVTGTVQANKFIGDGSQLYGLPGSDKITSGTAFVRATQDTGGEVSGTFKVTSTGSETCNPSTYNSIRVNPTTNKIEICRP